MGESVVPGLDDLVASIEGRAGDPLARLTAAVLVGQHLDDVADHLIGHFVDQAREAGASWTAIGQSLGVTKQAAQKRFVPNAPETAEADLRVFARYTDRARMAIVRAQEQARRHAAAEIRPGHVLLAVLEDEQTRGILGELDLGAARAAIRGALGTGTNSTDGPIPFSAASKKALELGHREAVRDHQERIEPMHVMLGVLAMTDEPDIAACVAAGLTRDRIDTQAG